MSGEPIRVGLLGHGYWGKNLARVALNTDGVDLVVVADHDGPSRLAAQSAAPQAKVIDDGYAAIADPDVAAILLATPASTHAELCRSALDAGKHVFVEKPLAMTGDDARDLVKRAASSRLTLMVGHTFLYAAPVLEIRRRIVSGELGEIRYFSSDRLNLGRVRSDCDVIWNLGPHDVSIVTWLMSEAPTIVSAVGHAYLQTDIYDVVSATLTFPGGESAHIRLSWMEPRKVRHMTVVGSKRMITYDDVAPNEKLLVHDAGIEPSAIAPAFASLGEFHWRTRVGDVHIPQLELREPLVAQMDDFTAAIRSGVPPRSDARSGALVVRTLEAMSVSASRNGEPICVEPE